MFSVLIPVYNSEDYIVKTIESLRFSLDSAQLIEFEILILNDGSSDHTLTRIEQYLTAKPDNRIKIINDQNAGRFFARRKLAQSASFENIIF